MRLHILYGGFIKIVVFWDAMLYSVVDVSHVSANPVAATFMVKVKPMIKMKTAAETESRHGKTYY
jgi:hypothetical protein